MMEATRTSETSVDNYFTLIPDNGGSTYLWTIGPQLFYAHPWWWRQHVPLKRRSTVILRSSLMMEAARTSETSVDSYFTRQYIPEDNSELHTRRRVNWNLTFMRIVVESGPDTSLLLLWTTTIILKLVISRYCDVVSFFFVLSFILRIQPTWSFEFCYVLASR
jgi:hypothetical protein